MTDFFKNMTGFYIKSWNGRIVFILLLILITAQSKMWLWFKVFSFFFFIFTYYYLRITLPKIRHEQDRAIIDHTKNTEPPTSQGRRKTSEQESFDKNFGKK